MNHDTQAQKRTDQAPELLHAIELARTHGDQHSFSCLYDWFATGLYRLCYSLLLNAEDAEDVVQESFVYAFRQIGRYDVARASFRTWLYTIAVSRCRNMYRRKEPLMIDLSQMVNVDEAVPDDETPEALLDQQDTRELVHEALTALTPLLREAVVLRYGHDLTYREIAEIMDCPQKTAESRVRLAHQYLRGILHEGDARRSDDELRQA